VIRGRKRLDTYDAIVDDYIARCRPAVRGETRWFANHKSLKDVIANAAMARAPSGKRLDHQRRIPHATLQAWSEQLQAFACELAAARSFTELYIMISSRAHEVYGIGARVLGLRERFSVSVTDIPAPFRRLKPSEIEDCLCIYRDELAAIRHTI
jgi:hypothetical protein